MGDWRSELKKVWKKKSVSLQEDSLRNKVSKDRLRRSFSTPHSPAIPTAKTTAPVTASNVSHASPLRPPKIERPIPPLPSPVPSLFTPLSNQNLTRHHIFREAEDWVAQGGSTQYRTSEFETNIDIVIGVDFGTSYTKAAVGLNDKIFPVTWDGISKTTPPYLLASEYTRLPDGTAVIGQHPLAASQDVHRDLKLPFINPGVSNASVDRASVFLALVLRYVRAWVYQHHGGKIGRAKIRWQLNIGAPSNGKENDRLFAAYLRLANSAWALSIGPDKIRFVGAENRVGPADCPQGQQDLVSAPGIFPEFVAQMAGYMQSPQRVGGLHSLVDVGGGTLDVVTFIVHSVDDEDVFPFLVPDVRPLGTHGLLQNRFLDAAPASRFRALDELADIPNPEEFSSSTGIDLVHVNARDSILSKEINKVLRIVFDTTKARRYRKSDAWQSGVRTFFTGGGSNVALYRDAITNTRVPSAGGLQLLPLPAHPKLDGFPFGLAEYQRISVACGLAQDSYTLGRIVPAKEVGDDFPIATGTVNRPDRDDLYSK